MHVITGLRIGGAENQLRLLTRYTCTQPSVVALTHADEVADSMRADGVPVFDLGMRSNRDVTAVPRLARLMAREKPQVVHVHLYRATLYGRLAARLARVPVVVTTEHSLLDGVLEGRRTTASVRRLYLATEPLNSGTIAVSNAVAARLVSWGVRPDKVRVVPNGVEFPTETSGLEQLRTTTRRDLGLPADAQVIGGIGRLHPTKRWDLLLRALAGDLGADRRLLLVGEGEERDALQALAVALGVSDWVRMVGSRADLAPMLAAMDVAVSPSPQETFGLALVEAVVAGRPVVYVSSPGIEALGPLPGVTKALAREDSLRVQVLAALEGPRVTPPSSALADYDIRSVAAQVDAVYDGLLQRRGRP